MGRPIDSKYFGPDAGGDGFQITGQAWIPGDTAAKACYIVRQRSNRKFEVADAATGLIIGVCKLADANASALVEGEMSIAINGGADYARKITAHRVYGFAGGFYVWSDITKEADSATDSVDADLGDDTDVDA
jgi:hypothetical protein